MAKSRNGVWISYPHPQVSVARAFEVANAPDSAIAAYEQYLAETSFDRLRVDRFALAPIHERLGQRYEARGEKAAASEHYGRFAVLWRNADPELQPRVAAAKQALLRLGGDRPR